MGRGLDWQDTNDVVECMIPPGPGLVQNGSLDSKVYQAISLLPVYFESSSVTQRTCLYLDDGCISSGGVWWRLF
jgi:hypothetical protein